MSTQSNRVLTHDADVARDTALEALNLFMDGELALDDQGPLFGHMADCVQCRRQLEHVMRFRRMSRMEHLAVPPAVDDAFFKRLDAHRITSTRVNRSEDRRPLWQSATPVSFRAALIVALVVFLTGLFLPSNNGQNAARGYVIGTDETTEFPDMHLSPGAAVTVYVFYPGLTVEAALHEE